MVIIFTPVVLQTKALFKEITIKLAITCKYKKQLSKKIFTFTPVLSSAEMLLFFLLLNFFISNHF